MIDVARFTILSSTMHFFRTKNKESKTRKSRSYTLASDWVLLCAQLVDKIWAQLFGRSYMNFLLKRTTAIIIALYCATRGASLPAIEKDYSPRRHLPRFLPTKQGYPTPLSFSFYFELQRLHTFPHNWQIQNFVCANVNATEASPTGEQG